MGVSLTYEAIVQAIGNFSAGKCMGNNGFGSTYKTEIALGSLVAVKRLSVGRFQGVTTVSCRAGTIGNVAPDYATTCRASEKADVHS
ncbi:hypothetical protein Goshw_027573 [Gossypium schwendimanii]|uniref:Protein kinase domain-containing protein n=1 Tax=Gossypium schwendimanii TaxID=34291 RepID=A0A7J9NDN2_GOSSC|nr:hypothetical protein [Gossypium schwendimanii]